MTLGADVYAESLGRRRGVDNIIPLGCLGMFLAGAVTLLACDGRLNVGSRLSIVSRRMTARAALVPINLL